MTTFTDRRWAVALLFITPALWSVNYIVGRLAPGIVAPHMLALLRWGLAGLILAAFATERTKNCGSASMSCTMIGCAVASTRPVMPSAGPYRPRASSVLVRP